jgi:class 3 adenylate cyclase
VCSVACGSDILFAEQALARGAELHVVLPYDHNDFYSTSVDFGLSGVQWKNWRSRCDAVLARATEVHYATPERYLGDDFLVAFNNEFTQGLAILRAAQRGIVPHALVVCDPVSAKLVGGTVYFLDQWHKKGLQSTLIDLRAIRETIFGPTGTQAASTPQQPVAEAMGGRMEREMKSMLFADVKNFSTLTDPLLPRFFLRFLGEVQGVLASLANPPVARNTWGDGLYLVFDHVTDCAEAALRLLECSEQMDWTDLGLGKDSGVRIGVHTGPVFKGVDPIIDRLNYFGSQVTRAARIEPVTMPGCAYASEQFAALLTVEAGEEYVCEYIGVEQLAKHYDRCVLYRLARR